MYGDEDEPSKYEDEEGKKRKDKDAYVKEMEAFRVKDLKAKEFIVDRLEEGPMTHITTCKSAFEIWDKLCSLYGKINLGLSPPASSARRPSRRTCWSDPPNINSRLPDPLSKLFRLIRSTKHKFQTTRPTKHEFQMVRFTKHKFQTGQTHQA